jgi:hypothetical protein
MINTPDIGKDSLEAEYERPLSDALSFGAQKMFNGKS